MPKILLCLLFLLNINGFGQTPGLPDPSFTTGVGADYNVSQSILQPDNKIILVGFFSKYHNKAARGIARINNDGSLDTTFKIGNRSDNDIFCVALQPDGKIIIGGAFTSYDNISINRIARLMPNGDLDTTFKISSGANNLVQTIKLQQDGKILIGGSFGNVNGNSSSHICRLNSDGTYDSTFSNSNGRPHDSVYSFDILQNGKILIAGSFKKYNNKDVYQVALLNPDASLDTTFSTGSGTSGGLSNTVGMVGVAKVLPDGKIIIGGDFTSFNGVQKRYLARLNSDGSVDQSFNNSNYGPDARVWTITTLSDSSMYIGGPFSTYNNVAQKGFVHVLANGEFDTSFNPGGSGTDNAVRSILCQEDGGVIIAGYFNFYNGDIYKYITRLYGNLTAPVGKATNETQAIKIYPNPFQSALNLFTPISGNEKIKLYDLYGKTVLEADVKKGINEIKTTELKNGNYILIDNLNKIHKVTKN